MRVMKYEKHKFVDLTVFELFLFMSGLKKKLKFNWFQIREPYNFFEEKKQCQAEPLQDKLRKNKRNSKRCTKIILWKKQTCLHLG